MDVYTLYTLYTLVYPSVISLTAPVIAILLRHAQHPCVFIPVNHHFCPQNPPKCTFFCIFLPKNLQNPKCSSYLCTVFRDKLVFCQNSTRPPMSRPCFGLATGSVKLPDSPPSEFPQNSTPLFLDSSPGLNPGQPYSPYSYYSH